MELNTGLPGFRRIQKMIQNKSAVEIKLISADVVSGQVRWQDPECICLVDGSGNETLVWRQAILYLKPM